MNAKVIVLLKRDLTYKLKLVTNEDWGKKVWVFLGLSVRGHPHKTRLTSSSFADLLWFAYFYWRPLFIMFFEALRISLSRYSSLDIRLYTSAFFSFSSAFLSPYFAYFGVLCNFLARFSRLALRLLLFAFFGSSVSFFPAYFTHSSLYRNSNRNNLRLTKLQLCQYCCFASWLKIFEILRVTVQTTSSPVWFLAQNAGGKLLTQIVHIY